MPERARHLREMQTGSAAGYSTLQSVPAPSGLDAFLAEEDLGIPRNRKGDPDEVDPMSVFAVETTERRPAEVDVAPPAGTSTVSIPRGTMRLVPAIAAGLIVTATIGFGTFTLLRRPPGTAGQSAPSSAPPPVSTPATFGNNTNVAMKTARVPAEREDRAVDPSKVNPVPPRTAVTRASLAVGAGPAPVVARVAVLDRIAPPPEIVNQTVANPPAAPPSFPVRAPAAPAAALPTGGVPLSVPAPAVVAAPAPGPAEPTDEAAITSVLNGYRRAFNALDPSAAKAVWPSVDARTLGKAFDQLAEQRFEFDACRIEVASRRAVASCGGRAEYVPKVGLKTARVEPRQWTFTLRQSNREWLIDAVSSR